MIILSPFTDYYDYVAAQLDSRRIVYKRDTLTVPGTSPGTETLTNPKLTPSVHGLELQVPLSYLDWLPANFSTFSDYNLNAAGTGIDYKFCWLVICNRMFLVVRKPEFNPRPEYRAFIPEYFPDEVQTFLANFKYYRNKKVNVLSYQGMIEDRIIQISRVLGHPVYVIEGVKRKAPNVLTVPLILYPLVPCLKNTGVSKTYNATELYQDIAYYLLNILRDSPDSAPPVEVQDKYKVIQHGFDQRSFRH